MCFHHIAYFCPTHFATKGRGIGKVRFELQEEELLEKNRSKVCHLKLINSNLNY